jgi:hypothetical protein
MATADRDLVTNLFGCPGSGARGNSRRSRFWFGRWFYGCCRRRCRRGCHGNDRARQWHSECRPWPANNGLVVGTGVTADEERPCSVTISWPIRHIGRGGIGTAEPRSRESVGPAGRQARSEHSDHRPICPSHPRCGFHQGTPSRTRSPSVPSVVHQMMRARSAIVSTLDALVELSEETGVVHRVFPLSYNIANRRFVIVSP